MADTEDRIYAPPLARKCEHCDGYEDIREDADRGIVCRDCDSDLDAMELEEHTQAQKEKRT